MGLLDLYQNNPRLNGSTPYRSTSDPTVYPVDSNHIEGTRGYFAQPASASAKFNQSYDVNHTYSDFIKKYI